MPRFNRNFLDIAADHLAKGARLAVGRVLMGTDARRKHETCPPSVTQVLLSVSSTRQTGADIFFFLYITFHFLSFSMRETTTPVYRTPARQYSSIVIGRPRSSRRNRVVITIRFINSSINRHPEVPSRVLIAETLTFAFVYFVKSY